jgi:hypothetical protein
MRTRVPKLHHAEGAVGWVRRPAGEDARAVRIPLERWIGTRRVDRHELGSGGRRVLCVGRVAEPLVKRGCVLAQDAEADRPQLVPAQGAGRAGRVDRQERCLVLATSAVANMPHVFRDDPGDGARVADAMVVDEEERDVDRANHRVDMRSHDPGLDGEYRWCRKAVVEEQRIDARVGHPEVLIRGSPVRQALNSQAGGAVACPGEPVAIVAAWGGHAVLPRCPLNVLIGDHRLQFRRPCDIGVGDDRFRGLRWLRVRHDRQGRAQACLQTRHEGASSASGPGGCAVSSPHSSSSCGRA